MAKCAYCGKERPDNELKAGKIIYRTRKYHYGKCKHVACVAEKTNLYCKDGPCHGYDQMAHEG